MSVPGPACPAGKKGPRKGTRQGQAHVRRTDQQGLGSRRDAQVLALSGRPVLPSKERGELVWIQLGTIGLRNRRGYVSSGQVRSQPLASMSPRRFLGELGYSVCSVVTLSEDRIEIVPGLAVRATASPEEAR